MFFSLGLTACLMAWVLTAACEQRVPEDFFQSARIGDITKLKQYLRTIPINSYDAKGNSAMIIASGRGQVETIKVLLEHGANAEDTTQFGLFEGKSALCWAASQGRSQAVALLLQAGADPHRAPPSGVFEGKTALMWASSQGRAAVVRLLLSAGVDVDHSSRTGNFQGKNSLMWASSQGRLDSIAVLLEAGADVNAVDIDGVSALMWACGSETSDENHKKGLLEKANKGHSDVVLLLLQYGALVDMTDNDGITAIMYASYHGHASAVEVLLNWGADADIKNKVGRTALHLARNAGFDDAATAILKGPTIMSLAVPDMLRVSACGWLLSVLRAPRGTGVYPVPASGSLMHCSSNNNNNNNEGSKCVAVGDDGKEPSSSHGHGRGHATQRSVRNAFNIANSCGVLHELGLDHSLEELMLLIVGALDLDLDAVSGGASENTRRCCESEGEGEGESGSGSEKVVGNASAYGVGCCVDVVCGGGHPIVVTAVVNEVVEHLGGLSFAARERARRQLRALLRAYVHSKISPLSPLSPPPSSSSSSSSSSSTSLHPDANAKFSQTAPAGVSATAGAAGAACSNVARS